MEKKDLGTCVLNVLELRSKMRSDKLAFEEGVKSAKRLRELEESCPISVIDNLYERLMESYVDYNRAHHNLPEETQTLVGHDKLPSYFRSNLTLY